MLPKPTADAAAERTNINFPDHVARFAASVDDIKLSLYLLVLALTDFRLPVAESAYGPQSVTVLLKQPSKKRQTRPEMKPTVL